MLDHDPHFVVKEDALGLTGLANDTKLAIALNQLCYGEAFD